MPSGGASSATSTTVPSSASSRWRCGSRSRSKSTPEASALLDEATTELETAIGEVRGLARGVHPTILTESGLAAAIDALAERTPIPVVADVVDRRFDATDRGDGLLRRGRGADERGPLRGCARGARVTRA